MTTRARYRDERGASLVIVMIMVTVVALVTGALLSQADASLKATVGLRDQAGSAYNGDGAAQAAINELRKGIYSNVLGTECFTGNKPTLALPGFYPAPNGQGGATATGSASVTCAGEPGTGSQGAPVPISANNKPGNAILTLGATANDGQVYGQSNKKINIHGGVLSNSKIDSSDAQLTATGGAPVAALGACSGTITPACTHFGTPVPDPNYPAPTALPAPPVSLPSCNNNNHVAVFKPGLYTNADLFNDCKASWMLFAVGTYYFDFTSATKVWTVNGTVVGGTVPGLNPDTGTVPPTTPAPAIPGACVNPILSTLAQGVQFVFGGSTQMVMAKDSNFEICATYHEDSIPTAVYGLKADIVNGTNVAHAQTGCVVAVVSGCDLISDGGNGTKPTFFFEGFVYAPRASVNLAVNNTTQPYFNFGVVLRSLILTTTGSASTNALISLPDNSPGYGTASTIVDLTVYVCPDVTTSDCSTHASRRLQLTARVQITDPGGTPIAGQRQITVLSWGMRR